MSEFEPGSQFLKQKYQDLHVSPEAKSASFRTEKRTGEKVSQKPTDRIQNYLERFNEILNRQDPEKRERGMEALKQILYDKFVIKPQEIPEGYFDNQRRIAREQGHGDIEVTDEMRNQLTEVIVADQKSSLDKWIDYLSSNDATYPDWLKYFAIRSILYMGSYDKGKKKFSDRKPNDGTVKPFPDLNREALAYVLDIINKRASNENINFESDNKEEQVQFQKIVQSENFAKLYAWAIDKITPASKEALTNTTGEWIKYNQNSDHMPLVKSLQTHSTGWCTAGESTAEAQLKNGDFYVYYSLDEKGKPTIPRAAIRMQGNHIAEVRGIAPEQNLDPYIADVVKEKLSQFPDGKAYEKKTNDMKQLTMLEAKTQLGQELAKEDLTFLYEINSTIEGFGYQKDPRIAELRSQRNPEQDMLTIFNCSEEQIAHYTNEINQTTRVYLGKLEPGVFNLIQKFNIEHIFTTFPEGKIRISELQIGGKTKNELAKILKETKINGQNLNVNNYAWDMIKSDDFTTLTNPEQIITVTLRVGDLGFSSAATTEQIYAEAEEFGLELCPAEVGVYQRLKDIEQPLDNWYSIAMKQISGRTGHPYVFNLGHDGDGLWLGVDYADPADRWNPDNRLVFRLRNVSQES